MKCSIVSYYVCSHNCKIYKLHVQCSWYHMDCCMVEVSSQRMTWSLFGTSWWSYHQLHCSDPHYWYQQSKCASLHPQLLMPNHSWYLAKLQWSLSLLQYSRDKNEFHGTFLCTLKIINLPTATTSCRPSKIPNLTLIPEEVCVQDKVPDLHVYMQLTFNLHMP